MRVIKVTDRHQRTKNGFQWKLGVTYHNSGGDKPTGEGFFHSFPNMQIARLVAPIVRTNVKYDGLRAFYGEAGGKIENMNGIEVASTRLVIQEECEVPTYNYDLLREIWQKYADWVQHIQPSQRLFDFVCERNSYHFIFGRPYRDLVIEADEAEPGRAVLTFTGLTPHGNWFLRNMKEKMEDEE